MYQQIDFSKTGGFPLTQDAMAFLQDAYNQVLSSLTGVIGDPAIIQGVVSSGGNVSDGWVSLNGEIVPFVGAPVSQGANVSIQETVTSVTYRDSGLNGVIITHKAILGSTGTALSSFTRIDLPSLEATAAAANSAAAAALIAANAALAAANAANTTANNALAAATGAAIPSGMIMIWHGSVATIPTGWHLCDGTNGTPNLGAKFVPCVGVSGPYSYVPGSNGGENFHTLIKQEMPPHDHITHAQGSILGSGGSGPWFLSNHSNRYSGGGNDQFGGTTSPDSNMRTSIEGGTNPHENRPEFYALCYIMKL